MVAIKRITIKILISVLIMFYPLVIEGIEEHIVGGAHPSVFPNDMIRELHRDNSSEDEQKRWNEPHFISEEVLIKFRQDIGTDKYFNMPLVEGLNIKFNKVKIERIFPSTDHSLPSNSGYRAPMAGYQADNLSHWYKVKLPEGVDVEEFIQTYQNHPDIEFIEPNFIYKIATSPNDSYYNSRGTWGQDYEDLWGLYKIYSAEGWGIEIGKEDVIVAVVDTGLDCNHPDIIDNLWVNEYEIPGNYVDDDGNGYVDDINGWNFVDLKGEIKDGHGHGTHVAGIIAGVGNNGIGVTGVSWNARVMALRGLNNDGYGLTGDLAKGIRYAVDNGARVINMSWGGKTTSKLITEALDYAYSKGCVLIAAAGNSNSDAGDFFPANHEKSITVAATDPEDHKATFSNWGNVIDVSAPGFDILSLRAEGTDMYKDNEHIVDIYYYRASGTSMAAPYVSGLAALILSRNPNLYNYEVELVINYSADDLGVIGKDTNFGNGRINVYKALETASGNLPAVKKIVAVDTPGDSGHNITLSWDNEFGLNDIKGYRIYYSNRPFRSIHEEGIIYFEDSPTGRSDVYSCVVTGLGDESYGYYFAIIANIFNSQPNLLKSAKGDKEKSQTPTSGQTVISTIQPVYPVNNVVDTASSDDIIIAGTDPKTKAIIPQGTNNGKILDINIPGVDVSVGASANKQNNIDYLEPNALDMTITEFKASDPIEGKIIISVSYPPEVPYQYQANLRIYELDEFTNIWKILPGIQNVFTDEEVVTAEVYGSQWNTGGTYRLFVTLYASENLKEVKVYPNPYKPNSDLGHIHITFDNLTENAKIRIFNIAGELVRTMTEEDTDGRYDWNATNDNNQRLASGVYIYLITNDNGQKKIGKLAVIR